ncbi:MAG: exonuclease subunit SbcD [Calditrichaeota bacterium]|nr:MAG: exonuclease subunit SbcD [Calditrichota bacterium]
MRILHTSDWHLGARLCDRDRYDEHKSFLDWLLQTIRKEKIDILLVSGDIFDSSNPPNQGEALYYDFLCALKDTGLISTILIGGNHDSISKLNSPRALLSRLDIHVIGGACRSPEDSLIPVIVNGEVLAVVCAVPFLRERDIRVPVPGESWDERERDVAEGIASYFRRTAESASEAYDLQNIPLIGMGHLFVTGSRSGEGERDLYVGNLGAVTSDIFSDQFDYIALGHIHRHQMISGRQEIRYCGSPLPMDFGENDEKTVILAEFEGKSLIRTETINVPVFRKLLRFKGSFDEVSSQIDAFSPPSSPFWAEAELVTGFGQGDISTILNEKASEKGFEFLRIKIVRNPAENIIENQVSREIKDLTPLEVFSERCHKACLEEKDKDELLPLFKELLVRIETPLEENDED